MSLSQYFANRKTGYSPTGVQYVSFYLFLFRYGITNAWQGVAGYQFDGVDDVRWDGTRSYYTNFYLLATAIVYLTPAIAIVIIGTQRLFNFALLAFDQKNETNDGKFIAELMMELDNPIVGMEWWVHLPEHASILLELNANSIWPLWVKGEIDTVESDNFTINIEISTQLPMHIPTKYTLKLSNSSASRKENETRSKNISETTTDEFAAAELETQNGQDDLMHLAAKNLRCVDWQTFTEELFDSQSVRAENAPKLYHLSRAVAPGEKVDFFISHCWSDDGKRKFSALTEVANTFFSKHRRYPTFWFDKLCFDQDKIGDGLRVLSINIMMCREILALYGNLYSGRLWCVWEIFTLFSFANSESAILRLHLCPIAEGLDLSSELLKFDVSNAHCYDPNEEAKIRKIIKSAGGAAGVEDFNSKIRMVGTQLSTKMRRSIRKMDTY